MSATTAELANIPTAVADAFAGAARRDLVTPTMPHGAPTNLPHDFNGGHSASYAPMSAPVNHAFGHGPNQQEVRREQASTQPQEDNAVAVPVPDTTSAGDKSKMQQMMLFFPDPNSKLTPAQQQEWSHNFQHSMSLMTPEERNDWMQKVQRTMGQPSQSPNAATHDNHQAVEANQRSENQMGILRTRMAATIAQPARTCAVAAAVRAAAVAAALAAVVAVIAATAATAAVAALAAAAK
ncbi:hypothetical protein H4S03_008002 [Coemansia sp. S3946]|nr:hypothetical protein H4S03_008002 [Coemansia sp. S3946]